MLKLNRTHTILAIAAAFASLLPIAAHAQKPALTQNIDEKGRVPYHSSQSSTSSFNGEAILLFQPVPAGFRLVITDVSVAYTASSSSLPNYVVLSGGTFSPYDTANYDKYLPSPTSAGSSFYISSSPVNYYVESFGQPYAQFSDLQAGKVFYASITGYLVNLNQ